MSLFNVVVADMPSNHADSVVPNIISNKLITLSSANIWSNEVEGISSPVTANRRLWVRVNGITTVEQLTAYFTSNPTTVVYELATPTTESATPYSQYQVVNDWGTEELTDYEYEQGNRDVAIPVGNNSKYPTNLVDKLNHLPTLADADGDYIIRQSGTQMSLVSYADVHELPDAPTTDGTYVLKCTVTNGVPTHTWESE